VSKLTAQRRTSEFSRSQIACDRINRTLAERAGLTPEHIMQERSAEETKVTIPLQFMLVRRHKWLSSVLDDAFLRKIERN